MAPRCLSRYNQFILQRLRREGDTPTVVRQKALLFNVLAMCFLVAVPTTFSGEFSIVTTWTTRYVAACFLGLMCILWISRSFAGIIEFFTLNAIITISILDVAAIGFNVRLWPLFIMLFSFFAITRSPRWMGNAAVVCITVYVVLIELELSTRMLGILDLPGLVPYADRRQVTDCVRPPCARPEGMREMPGHTAAVLGVLLINFYAMRAFSDAIIREKERVTAAITAAQHIAESLARFDLECAGDFVDTNREKLPAELLDSLETLLSNLESYRPYLPYELLNAANASIHNDECGLDESARRDTQAITTEGACHAAIVFTDICGSTALWEHSGAAMKRALEIHNDLIRYACSLYDGYEVKTIGDAFMIAFVDPASAVRFALRVQKDFARDGLWPTGLHRPGLSDNLGTIALRIGVHYGDVSVEHNKVSQRYDYFGTTVNRAARVEAHGAPGAVTITREVAAEVPEILEEMIVVPYAKPRAGKGLAEPLHLTAVLPTELAPRETLVREHCDAAPDDLLEVSVSSWSSERSISAHGNRSVSESARSETSSQPTPMGQPSHRRHRHHHAPRGVFQRTIRASASVCVLKYDFWGQQAHGSWESAERSTAARLQEVHLCLSETNGQLSTVLHNVALVSWGLYTSGRQNRHIHEATRFLANLHVSWGGTGGGAHPPFHAGIACGPVATGQIAASNAQKFLTTLGPCVDASFMLCSAAAELGAVVLAASLGVDDKAERYETSSALRGAIRPVDRWRLCEDTWATSTTYAHAADVTVYEISLSLLAGTTEPSAGAWGQAYTEAFEAADVKRLDAIAPNDGVARAVCALQRRKMHCAHRLARYARVATQAVGVHEALESL